MSLQTALANLGDPFNIQFNIDGSTKAASDLSQALREVGVRDDPVNAFVLDSIEFNLVSRLGVVGPEGMNGEFTVSSNDFFTALEKLRCPWLECSLRLLRQPTFSDVIPFPGDLQKSGMDPNMPVGVPAVVSAIASLTRIYAESSRVGRYRAVLDSPVLPIQGGLWALRAQVLSHPRPFASDDGDLPSIIDSYREALNEVVAPQ